MCVCVCVWLGYSCSFKHVSLNSKGKFCLYKYLGFRLELVDEFTKIVLSAFGLFIGYHQGLLACVRSVVSFFK